MASSCLLASRSSTTPLPSSSQIALALSIVRSKPNTLLIEENSEYITSLRQHLVSGSKLPSIDQHIDSAAFWRSEYGSSEAVQIELRNRIHELEHKSHVERYARELDTEPTNDRKRKHDEATSTKANSRSKRIDTPGRIAHDDVHSDHKFLDSGDRKQQEGTFSILGAVYLLNQEFKHSPTDPTRLLTRLRAVCNCTVAALKDPQSTCLSDTVSRLFSENTLDDLLYRNVCTALKRIYLSILRALDELRKCDSEGGKIQMAISHISFLFQTLLTHLSTFVTGIAGSKYRTTRSTAKSTSKKDKSKDTDYIQMCQSITTALTYMLTTLDLLKEVHCFLFEALMCLFLDHLGSSLSLLVFGTGQAPLTKRGELQLGVLSPQGLRDSVHIDQKTAILSCEIEAPFVISILSNMMKKLDDDEKVLATMPATSTAGVIRNIRSRIQTTLLRGVFGDDDENFRDALQRPKTPESDNMKAVNDIPGPAGGTSEWFIGEVWEHLGWGILAEHVGMETLN